MAFWLESTVRITQLTRQSNSEVHVPQASAGVDSLFDQGPKSVLLRMSRREKRERSPLSTAR
jgi:hypothetical protein